MLRNSLRVVLAVFIILVAAVAVFQIERDEADYPLGTQYSVSVDFAGTAVPKKQLVGRVDDLAARAKSSILLAKAAPDDPANGLNVYWFGQAPAGLAPAGPVPWFAAGRSGKLLSSARLGPISLTGWYSFYDRSVQADFAKLVAAAGGRVTAHGQAPSAWVLHLGGQDNSALTLLAVLVLVVAVSWVWVSGKDRAFLVLRQSGKSVAAILAGALADFTGLLWPPVVAALLLSNLFIGLTRPGAGARSFLTMSVGTTVAFLVLLLILMGLSLLLLIPKLSQLASRQPRTTLSRQVSVLLKLVALFIVLAALPGALSARSVAVKQYEDVAAWRNASNVVSLQYSASSPEITERDMKNSQPFFKAMAETGTMALSYSVGSMLTSEPTDPANPPATFHFGRFDQVIVTDTTFMRLMKVPPASLEKVRPTEIPDSLSKELVHSDSIWLLDSQTDSLLKHLYRWTGPSLFPALRSDGYAGTMSKARNPLILLFDRPAQQLSAANFLFPAITTGNVLFTDATVVSRGLEKYGLMQSFYSVNTVADSALLMAQEAQATAWMNALAGLTSLVVILFCAVQSARTWASERIRAIFLLHSGGKSYLGILKGRILLSLVSVAVVGGLNYLTVKSWQTVNHSLLLLGGVLLGYFCVELVFGLLQSRGAFRRAVLRNQE